MRYADVIWGSLSNSKKESLQRLQDRAAAMIHTSRIKDNWAPKFLAIEQPITFDGAITVYKIFNKLYPENPDRDLKLPLKRTNNGQKGYSFRGAKSWNGLSAGAKCAPSLASFKTYL